MSQRVLSQAGTSLADVYDVKGSVAGIDRLDVDEIKGVHDLGPQIHTERLNAFGLIISSTAIAQNINFAVVLDAPPDSINRINSISVIADTAGRINFCSVAIRDPGTGVDHPIWAWDTADDVEKSIRWAGPSLATLTLMESLSQVAGSAPNLMARWGNTWAMPNLVFLGQSGGFGAGTVLARALIQVVRPDQEIPIPAGAPSSHGLPIPSW